MLLKILGGIDLLAALTFLMLTFGISVFIPLILFSAGLLLIKSLFIFSGDVLSFVDLFSAIVLIISILLTLPVALLWIPTFLLLAKGFVSFL